MFMYIWAFFNKQYTVFILPKHFVKALSNWKKIFAVSPFTPCCGANETVPLPYTNIFPIWTKWATTPIVCYSSQQYGIPSVQFYTLCPVLLGVIMGFNGKFFIIPHATLQSIFNKKIHLFWLRHSLAFLCTSQTKDRLLQKNLEKQKFYIYGALSLPSDFRTKKKKN